MDIEDLQQSLVRSPVIVTKSSPMCEILFRLPHMLRKSLQGGVNHEVHMVNWNIGILKVEYA